MEEITPARHSIHKQITLTVLLIFITSIWALSYYASRMLREDMQRLLGEQQFSTVSYMAAEINRGLEDRIKALELIARAIEPAMLGKPSALQKFLDQRFVLHSQFNAGVFALSSDGVAIADVSDEADRIGTSYADYDAVRTALIKGKSSVGQPKMGRKLPAPVFTIVAPIRDNQGKVIGALAGTTNLKNPNFLDKISEGRYGKTGGYLLVAPQHNVFITASDKSRVMQPLPAPGINSMHDKCMQGYEGYGVAVSSRGVEELSAAKGIPAAGWFLAAILPSEEAFFPIRDMQRRLIIAATLLTLLAAMLTWWTLRRQLSPLWSAAEKLAAMSEAGEPLQSLPVVRQDEIGELIGGFNRLLETLGQREQALKESEAFKLAILNSVAAEIAVLDRNGVILAVNQPWQRFALENGIEPGKPAPGVDTGANYLAVCQADDALEARDGIRAVLEGRLPNFSVEYPCHSPQQQRWFSMNVTPLGEAMQGGVVITHTDITERKQAETRLIESETHLRTIIENEPECIKIIDAQGRLVQMNPAGLAMIEADSLEQVAMRPVLDVIAPEFRMAYAKLHKQVIAGEAMQMQYEVLGVKGGRRWLETHAVPMKESGETVHLAVTRDITERRQAEMALQTLNETLEQRVLEGTARNMAQERLMIQQSRLAAMGEMIGNIAHQWRQPINALTLILSNIKDAYEYNDLTKEYLDREVIIGQELIQKMSSTIDDFRSFFKPNKEKQRFLACDSVEEAVKLVSHSFMNNHIEITSDKSREPSAVFGYPNEFAQVVLNALTNAKEAIIAGNIAGKVHIKVEKGKNAAAVSIRDNGGGISEEIMSKVFDPYFTTKEKGTGIGLYMSKMIMDNMGGDIAIRNVDDGVEVLISLPLAK